MSEPLIVKEKDYEYFNKTKRIKTIATNKNPLTEDRSKTANTKRIKKNQTNKFGAIKRVGATVDTSKSKANLKGKTDQEVKKATDPLQRGQPKNDPLSRLQTKPDQIKKQTVVVLDDPLSKSKAKDSKQGQLQEDQKKLQQEESEKNLQKQKQLEQEKRIQEENEVQKKVLLVGDDWDNRFQENNDQINEFWGAVREDFLKIHNIKTISPKQDLLVNNPFGQQAITNEDRAVLRIAQSGSNKAEYGVSYQQQEQMGKTSANKITIKNFLGNINQRMQNMKQKWEEGNKVGGLQITIQQIKLLMDNEVPIFAPLKYVHVIDILETFGELVYMRMKKLSFPAVPESELKKMTFSQIQGSNIPESAQEICRNWIKKVGSIRELMPRMYIECALLPIYYFINAAKIKSILLRLTFSSRAIGDYISSIYFSTYLIRIAAQLLPKEKSHILLLIQDFFFYMKQGQTFFGKQGISSTDYMKLFQPFLITAFKYYCNNCSDQEFYDLFFIFKQSNQHSDVLSKIIETFPAKYISVCAGEIFVIIQNYHIDIKSDIYTIFLPKILQGMQNQTALADICNLVWFDLVQVQNFTLFLNILASLLELVQKSLTGFEKNKFFSKIIDKFNQLFSYIDLSGGKNADIFQKMESFISNILGSADNVKDILTMEPFLQFIQYFPTHLRANVSQSVLKIFLERNKNEIINDPLCVHALLQVSKFVNQEISIKQDISRGHILSGYLKNFLKLIDFGKDLESMLNLFTEFRSNFGNLIEIVEVLIYKVLDLTFLARKLTKKKMSSKIKSFLQAAIAFCYISITMNDDKLKQLQLFITCSQTALLHNLISQSEVIFKSALTVLSEIPEQINGKYTDELLQKTKKTMICQLLIIPDDPEKDYLHLFTGFYNLVQSFKWSKKNGEIYKMSLLLDFLKYLCIQIQDKLPFHIEGVVSNDQLFSEPEFKQTIVVKIDQCLTDIEKTIKEMKARQVIDVYSVEKTLSMSLYGINTILEYFKTNQRINNIIKQFLELVQTKSGDLWKDRIGKIQLKNLTTFIQNTFQNIEKNTRQIEFYEEIKVSVMKNLSQNV